MTSPLMEEWKWFPSAAVFFAGFTFWCYNIDHVWRVLVVRWTNARWFAALQCSVLNWKVEDSCIRGGLNVCASGSARQSFCYERAGRPASIRRHGADRYHCSQNEGRQKSRCVLIYSLITMLTVCMKMRLERLVQLNHSCIPRSQLDHLSSFEKFCIWHIARVDHGLLFIR